MAIVNITADMNDVDNITISDAAAAAGSILIQFFTDGKNVFNIASQDLSGDAVDAITVNDDTSYEFDITAEQAQLLDGTTSTYKQYLLNGAGGKTLLNEGSVTVTPLTGGALATLVPYVNGNNVVKSAVALVLTEADDVVIFTNRTSVDCELPSAAEMPGKIFKIKAAGAGDVVIKKSNGDTLITLETTQESCEVVAVGQATPPDDELDWEVFFLI